MNSELIEHLMLLCIVISILIEGGIIESKLEDILTEMKKMEWHLDKRIDDGK